MMKDFKAAIFDLDGTLLDSLSAWKEVDGNFLKKRGIAVPDDYQQCVKGLNFQEAARYTIKRFALEESEEALAAEWRQMIRDEYAYRIVLRPYAKEYLEKLYRAGVKLAVATAGEYELFEPALKRNGIFGYFSVFATTKNLRGKHFPDVYFEAAKKLNVAPSECAVFEDVITAVRTAYQAGFYTVAVEEPSSLHAIKELKENSNLYITGFEELL